MAMNPYRRAAFVLVAFGSLTLLTGCDSVSNPADLASFIQQFAREAFSAFLL